MLSDQPKGQSFAKISLIGCILYSMYAYGVLDGLHLCRNAMSQSRGVLYEVMYSVNRLSAQPKGQSFARK